MNASRLCQDFIKRSLPMIHSRRVDTLCRHVESLLNHAHLTLTSLGRHAPGQATVKSKIHMAWRFLSNPGVHNDKLAIYRGIAAP